jgi:hypothetical protein
MIWTGVECYNLPYARSVAIAARSRPDDEPPRGQIHDRLRVDGGDNVSRPQPHASSSAPAQAVVELAAIE